MKKTLSKIWFYLKPYRLKLYFSIFFLLITVVMIAAAPLVEGFVTTQFMTDVTAMQSGLASSINFQAILNLIILLFAIYLINTVTRLAMQFLLTDAIQAATYDLRQAVKHKMTLIPIRYYDKHTAGDMMSRMSTDVETISNALQQSFAAVIQAVLMLIIAVIMMFSIDIDLALIGITIIPLSYLVSSIIIKKSQSMFTSMQNALAKLNSVTQEKLTGFNEIKLYNYQDMAISDFQAVNDDLCQNSFKANFFSGLMGPSVSVITYLCIAITIFLGAQKVMAGALVVGGLQSFIRYIWQVNQPLSQMTQLSATIQSSFAAMKRVFDFLEEPNDVADIDQPQNPESFAGAVEFKNVAFGYNDTPIIKDFTVSIKPGQMVAIVGPTGAGKTTIINLLMRFYDVNQGSIEIDGIDIRNMKRDDLRSLFGMVLQDTWLFSGRIRDNLAYGKPDATLSEIVTATKRSNVHHFIKTLPEGYDMLINEESSNISNGEKQLLTIARALLSDPKILILDEATSSVDTRLDAMIQEAMAELMKGRTSFVIAHRLTTIRNADVILVVKDGNIVEKGTHDELMDFNGFYADLYNSQFSDVVA